MGVPADFIKDAPVYWEAEVQQCLGIPLAWCGLAVPPPTLAALALLELLDNDFVACRPGYSGESVAVCLYVLAETTAAAEAMQPYLRPGTPPPKTLLDETAVAYFAECAAAAGASPPTVADREVLQQWLAAATSGYQMLPATGGGRGGLYLFGAPTMGGAVAGVAGALGGDARGLLWETSVCLIGHTIAARAMQNGAKGVGRPKDADDIRQQIADEKAREARGELHPWQLTRPAEYPLSERQAANPDAVARYNEALLTCRR